MIAVRRSPEKSGGRSLSIAGCRLEEEVSSANLARTFALLACCKFVLASGKNADGTEEVRQAVVPKNGGSTRENIQREQWISFKHDQETWKMFGNGPAGSTGMTSIIDIENMFFVQPAMGNINCAARRQ